ncbi:cobaltochelatase subunit CobN [Histidinibacterium aquaticum]|uniref:magnesium chelatase n=1 Tax=Histidinibacterium aquaticum TaxID=2613962 RepID=A0A5J5GGK9_9RHOB|nr:cobaltochelatase subunit CobN [Histidinibacterium aquaticum]KAA9006873.1 DUF3479 domain-containing protein [Histidinibacterium aquaticum]
MRDDLIRPYRVAIVTLDAHAAGPARRAALRLAPDFPGLEIGVHAAAEWAEQPERLTEAKEAVAEADLIVANMLFLEEHVAAILPDLEARRGDADALVGLIADPRIVKLTAMGELDMAAPPSALSRLMKKLRGSSKPGGASGEKQMRMLKRLPKILRLIPGKAQDLRAWFLSMQYWLGGSDDNIAEMLRFLVGRYADRPEFSGREAHDPVDYPELGLYHPDLPGTRITTDPDAVPAPEGAVATVGLLLMRSYILASDRAHYDAVIRAFEAKGLRVLPAFAGGLDGRPAIETYFEGRIDALVSLTGFSLVGGPAYNDSAAAVETLTRLDVPYLSAHPLEFQTIEQWSESGQGLGPIETTMLVALPEIDGASSPTVFAGRHGPGGWTRADREGTTAEPRAMEPVPERIEALADKTRRLTALRRKTNADKTVAIVLFNFPPNSGAAGTAAYLSVFESLHATLRRMKSEGYDVDLPETVEALREMVLGGNAERFGQDGNVAAHVSADEIVRGTPWLSEIEEVWGPAPGRHLSDGRGVHILGCHFGKVFVGLQPGFGWEGDPMRLMFEKGFAPTHAFSAFYLWLRESLRADAVLHFGMHGALEFMPGKQTGLDGRDWPDRLMGRMPHVYLYAANNPSEASLAKRRAGAVTISHLTPPLASAGLYKGLAALKDSLNRWRAGDDDPELVRLIRDEAAAVDLVGEPEELWHAVLETEGSLIPDGLHILGRPMSDDQKTDLLALMPEEHREAAAPHLGRDTELPALMRALSARYIAPVPGGDLIRSPEILPTGRNLHAFDPFRMPTAYALAEGAAQAKLLLEAHDSLPRSIALVLWGSDNIKSDGAPIGQALALIGARPRFDSFGRLAGADLIPLEELGRPRIDVVMTLSGIFRDLLPLQTRLLAEAAWKAAMADEPEERNFVRANTLAHAARTGCDLETAALRVFSNAEGTYGSNVGALVDGSAFGDEDELADAYQTRKCFAYGRNGRPAPQPELLQSALSCVDLAYQNLESVELGVTTVDHYFDTLGGISRAVRRARGTAPPVYIGDQTRGSAKVRTLQAQVALETRSRSLNPKFYESLLKHGPEGVRQIEAHVTNTLGWSATTGEVEPWVYQRLSETFLLDPAMRERLSQLNPKASARMAGRLLEASDRAYWQPDDATLEALQDAADAIEDRMEGIAAE